MEFGNLNFFDVEDCGLFLWKTGGKSYGFGLEEVFTSLQEWSVDRQVRETGIQLDHEANVRTSKPKCYVYDSHKDEETGDLFFVLLKSDGGNGKYLRGIKSDAVLGSADVKNIDSVKSRKNRIWGHPCYYWVIPEKDLVVSIKFPHSLTDASMFSDYIKGYVRNRAQHDLLEKEHLGKDRWTRQYLTPDKNEGLFFRFSMHQSKAVINSAAIKEIYPKVTHLIKRETVPIKSQLSTGGIVEKIPELREFLNGDYNRSRGLSKKKDKNSINLEYRVEVKATYKLVENVILDSDRNSGEWDCVGFLAEGRQVFAHDYRIHESISKPAKSGDIISASELNGQLKNQRQELLDKIVEEEKKSPNLKVVGE